MQNRTQTQRRGGSTKQRVFNKQNLQNITRQVEHTLIEYTKRKTQVKVTGAALLIKREGKTRTGSTTQGDAQPHKIKQEVTRHTWEDRENMEEVRENSKKSRQSQMEGNKTKETKPPPDTEGKQIRKQSTH